MIVGISGTILALIMGKLVHNYTFFHFGELTKPQLKRIVIYEAIGGIGFPLLPVSVLFNFILIMLRDNLFQG